MISMRPYGCGSAIPQAAQLELASATVAPRVHATYPVPQQTPSGYHGLAPVLPTTRQWPGSWRYSAG